MIRIHIPRLRQRPDDVPALARHFWQTAADRVGTRAVLTQGVVTALSRYHWPGNVRELQNVIAGLAVAAPPRGRVPASLVPAVVTGAATVATTRLADARQQFERRFIEVALARAGGSRSRVARDLGLSRQGLLKMMARLGIGEHDMVNVPCPTGRHVRVDAYDLWDSLVPPASDPRAIPVAGQPVSEPTTEPHLQPSRPDAAIP